MNKHKVTVYFSGAKVWLLNGMRHRVEGPALECHEGEKFWYLYGISMSEYEHLQKGKLWINTGF